MKERKKNVLTPMIMLTRQGEKKKRQKKKRKTNNNVLLTDTKKKITTTCIMTMTHQFSNDGHAVSGVDTSGSVVIHTTWKEWAMVIVGPFQFQKFDYYIDESVASRCSKDDVSFTRMTSRMCRGMPTLYQVERRRGVARGSSNTAEEGAGGGGESGGEFVVVKDVLTPYDSARRRKKRKKEMEGHGKKSLYQFISVERI